MSNTNKTPDFGNWLTKLASNATPMTATTLASLKAKLEKERQEQLEKKLRAVFDQMETQVAILRRIRETERATLVHIKELEAQANKIVAGKEE